jgi:hypothetical protein
MQAKSSVCPARGQPGAIMSQRCVCVCVQSQGGEMCYARRCVSARRHMTGRSGRCKSPWGPSASTAIANHAPVSCVAATSSAVWEAEGFTSTVPAPTRSMPSTCIMEGEIRFRDQFSFLGQLATAASRATSSAGSPVVFSKGVKHNGNRTARRFEGKEETASECSDGHTGDRKNERSQPMACSQTLPRRGITSWTYWRDSHD